jgi:5-methylcytosine-specific restriction endonuclease McrA
MNSYSMSHVSNEALLRDLATSVKQDRATTATMLAQIAEVDERQLYRAAAYESMYLYCLHELHMSEETAYRRIRVARTARKFPAIFHALADGTLHETAVVLLAPHLKRENAGELLTMAAHKTKCEIEALLAARFPRPDVPTIVRPILTVALPQAAIALPVDVSGSGSPAAQHVESMEPVSSSCMEPLAPAPVVPSIGSNAAGNREPLSSRPKVTPLSAESYAVQLTFRRVAHEKLRYAQALLGYAVPSGDLPEVLERGLDALIENLEKQKFAKSARSRPSRGSDDPRYVPAEVRRTVWERDSGQCTFVSEHGKRCEARGGLEFDHIETVARGGVATLSNIRLRCRAHNQYTAECTFGAGFMERKREAARSRAAEASPAAGCPG